MSAPSEIEFQGKRGVMLVRLPDTMSEFEFAARLAKRCGFSILDAFKCLDAIFGSQPGTGIIACELEDGGFVDIAFFGCWYVVPGDQLTERVAGKTQRKLGPPPLPKQSTKTKKRSGKDRYGLPIEQQQPNKVAFTIWKAKQQEPKGPHYLWESIRE